MFCATVTDIVNNILNKENIVLCRETASDFLGLSNGWGIPVQFYTDCADIINSAYVQGIKVDNLNSIYSVKINGIMCTTKEKTLCDMINAECDIQTILEALSTYYCENESSIAELNELANQMGITELLDEYTKDALKYYTE